MESHRQYFPGARNSMSQYHIIMYKLPSGYMDGWMLLWGGYANGETAHYIYFKGCDIIYINIS